VTSANKFFGPGNGGANTGRDDEIVCVTVDCKMASRDSVADSSREKVITPEKRRLNSVHDILKLKNNFSTKTLYSKNSFK